MADRDRTVSRRSKPSSRTALTGEQPDPWNLLQLQDATGRHRALVHRYRRRRLYLHPARPMGEGSAFCGVHRFALRVLEQWITTSASRASVVTGSLAGACI